MSIRRFPGSTGMPRCSTTPPACTRPAGTTSFRSDIAAAPRMKSGDKFSLAGFFTVDRKKLAALDEKQVVELFTNGDLEIIYAHLLSLDNFEKLMAKM